MSSIPPPGEMITIGGFYKHFKDPIEETYNEAGSGLQYTYHNAKNAETFGVELDVKKNLDFIGLRGLSFVCNAAYIYSRVRFEEGAPERDRPLAGQSPYLVNAGFFYQYDDKGISASLQDVMQTGLYVIFFAILKRSEEGFAML